MRITRFDWDGSDAAALARELRGLQPAPQGVADEVAQIIAAVAERGDAAIAELDRRFGSEPPESPLVAPERVAQALERVPDLVDPLELAAGEIRRVAEAEVAAESSSEALGSAGQQVSTRVVPVGSAGAYVPGGRASYPSSALMCCIPARAAGVERVAVASPPSEGGEPDAAVLAACQIAGADRVYAMGGVQAVAALALGTESVEPVDVIVGPGNRYVQEAKRQLFGRVGIEGIAGPSELMVLADADADPDRAALDLCAQAEHGEEGLLVAASADESWLDAVGRGCEGLAAAPGTTVADAPLALVRIPGPSAGIELANALSPEHLELQLAGAEELAEGVTTAGCVFAGEASATAFGDFVAGSNHVLPTGGAGRFAGPLGPRAFRRRIATVSIPPGAAAELAPAAATLAGAEGFPVHGESALARAREERSPQR